MSITLTGTAYPNLRSMRQPDKKTGQSWAIYPAQYSRHIDTGNVRIRSRTE